MGLLGLNAKLPLSFFFSFSMRWADFLSLFFFLFFFLAGYSQLLSVGYVSAKPLDCEIISKKVSGGSKMGFPLFESLTISFRYNLREFFSLFHKILIMCSIFEWFMNNII